MAFFLPALGIGARALLTRGLPRAAAWAGPRVATRFPQIGSAAARFGTGSQAARTAFVNSRPFGRIPGLRRIANFNPTILGRNPLQPTIFGRQFQLLNPKLGLPALTAETMIYDALARSEPGQQLQNRMREFGAENLPWLTDRIDDADAWLRENMPSLWGDPNTPNPRDPSTQPPTPPPAGTPDSADYSAYESRLRDAGQGAQVSLAGIQQQYDGVIEELKSQYQLAETDEEKERIRYIVADVEEQRKAGEKAIADVYAQKVQEINQRETKSREGTKQSRQDAGDVFRRSVDTLGSASRGSRQDVIGQNRGLGIGSAEFESGAQPWADFMTTMAPISENYAQRIGDIGSEAINFLGGVTGQQGAAQQADLTRLALATGSTAKMQHASEVAQRIAAERLALAQQMASLRSQQMSEIASGRELNAQLADSAASRRASGEGQLPARIEALVEARSWGLDNPELSYEDFAEWHERQYGVPPGADMFAAYQGGVEDRE